MSDSVRQAIADLIEAGLVTRDRIEGCTDDDVIKVESAFGLSLPPVYRRFLLQLGKNAGGFWTGTDFLFPELLGLKNAAASLLVECEAPWAFGRADFVFAVHQGYQFLFFTADGTDDPPVFHYMEGDEAPRRVAPTFSEWLSRCVADEVANTRAGALP